VILKGWRNVEETIGSELPSMRKEDNWQAFSRRVYDGECLQVVLPGSEGHSDASEARTMNPEGRRWLYRIFWRLSESAAVEEDPLFLRGILGAMFLIEELRLKGRVFTWKPELLESDRRRFSSPRVP
jgi:hypothetical protein